MTIGEQIQKLRIRMGLTQERFADLLEVSRQSVSKWELGQAVPEVDKIIRMSELLGVSTDTILLKTPGEEQPPENPLHLGSIYLIVKDFEKSVAFYERFLGGHCTDPESPYKFVQNYWVEDLLLEYRRVKDLNIGPVTEIRQVHPGYHYFHLLDPDNNVIEVTGGYAPEK